jgi:O-antigen/teichoic acid export membrane protein
VIVLATLGATSSAHFYMVTMIAMATQLVPTVLATSLLVEVASSKASFDVDGRRVVRQLVLLLGPIILVLVLFAEPILAIFGPGYAAEGADALRLLALAGVPYALINMAFIRLRLEGRVRRVVAAQAVLAGLLVVPGLIVLPAWGITGLAFVTLASQSAVAAVLTWMELRPLLSGLVGPRSQADPAAGVARAAANHPNAS